MKIAMAVQSITAAFCWFLPHTPGGMIARLHSRGGLLAGGDVDSVRQPRFLLLLSLAVLAHAAAVLLLVSERLPQHLRWE